MNKKKTRLSTEQFIIKSLVKHGMRYNYSKSKYITSHEKLIIICPVHGEFKQVAYSHMQGKGCPDCAHRGYYQCGKNTPIKKWVDKSHIIHKNKYDYCNVAFKTLKEKVIIKCPIHGNFQQEAMSHLRGHGCKQCSDVSMKKKLNGVYCQSYFTQHNNEKGQLYILRFKNDVEDFIKIGITKTTLTKRFGKKLPYTLEIIKIKKMLLKDAFNLEQHIKQTFSNYMYLPQHKFEGYTECFTKKILEVINV